MRMPAIDHQQHHHHLRRGHGRWPDPGALGWYEHLPIRRRSYKPAAQQPDRILPGRRPRFGAPVDRFHWRGSAGTRL